MERSIASQERDHPTQTATSPSPVWIIDDNKELSFALATIIEIIAGSPCTRCFASADAALEALAEGTGVPEVAFLDIQMPGTSGLDAIIPLKQAAPRCKIYMSTAAGSDAHRRTAKERGVDGFFLKLEITKDKLKNILETSLPALLVKQREAK